VIACAAGLSDWKKFDAKHREVLAISLDPQVTPGMLLKSKKFVNACLRQTASICQLASYMVIRFPSQYG